MVMIECPDQVKTTHLFAPFTKRDVILYALGIGCCSETKETSNTTSVVENYELRYVYENHSDFQPFPTFLLSLTFQAESILDSEKDSNVRTSRLGFGIRPFPPESFGDGSGSGVIPRAFFKDPSCIAHVQSLPVLHTKQTFTIHNALIFHSPLKNEDAPGGIFLESRIVSIDPRSIGAFVASETKFYQLQNQYRVCLATSQITVLVLGLDSDLVHKFGPILKRQSEVSEMDVTTIENTTKTYSYQVPTNAALIYRLSGDYNKIHVEKGRYINDDQVGTSWSTCPVLHGLCTLGYATRALVKHTQEMKCFSSSMNPKIRSMECDFVKPVFVGDSLIIAVSESDGYSFTSNVLMLRFKVYRSLEEQSISLEDSSIINSKRELVLDQGVAIFTLYECKVLDEVPKTTATSKL